MPNWIKENCTVFYLGESYKYGEKPPDDVWIPLGLVSHDSGSGVFTQFDREVGKDIALDEAVQAAWDILPTFYRKKFKGKPFIADSLGTFARLLDKRIILVYWDVGLREERMRSISAVVGTSEAMIRFEDYFNERKPEYLY